MSVKTVQAVINGHTYRCLKSASSSMMIPGTSPRYWEAVT